MRLKLGGNGHGKVNNGKVLKMLNRSQMLD